MSLKSASVNIELSETPRSIPATIESRYSVELEIPIGPHAADLVSIPEEKCFLPAPGQDIYFHKRGGSWPYRGGWCVSWIVQDPDPYSDWEWDDPFEEDSAQWNRAGWTDVDSCDREYGTEDTLTSLVSLHGNERVFLVDCVTQSYVIHRLTPYVDREVDYQYDHVLVVPADSTNPKEYAESMLGEYTKWLNGDVWGIVYRELSATGEVIEREEVWGYIGQEYAESAAKDAVAAGGL